MLQHSAGQRREQLGNFVQAESTAAALALVCWKRTSQAKGVDSGDLLNWSEDKKRKTFKLETFGHEVLKRKNTPAKTHISATI